MAILFRKEASDAILPTRANSDDAGMDLYAVKDYVINPSEVLYVDTGVSVAIPRAHVGLLFQRSSGIKRGIQLANCVGVIDTGYRGSLMAAIRNVTEETVITILKGERIAQLVVMPIWLTEVGEYKGDLETWRDSTRNLGGFGSSGK